MASSGILWIDFTLDFCVRLLFAVGRWLGISYEEVNVWLFYIIWPALTLLMLSEIWRLRQRLKRQQT